MCPAKQPAKYVSMSINLPEQLVRLIDELVRRGLTMSRSEFIRVAIQAHLHSMVLALAQLERTSLPSVKIETTGKDKVVAYLTCAKCETFHIPLETTDINIVRRIANFVQCPVCGSKDWVLRYGPKK